MGKKPFHPDQEATRTSTLSTRRERKKVSLRVTWTKAQTGKKRKAIKTNEIIGP